ncbi:WG containing repeat-containing protein [Filimonas lacunae]|uniref:WG containing repeat-containing protein n=1 Tax=Filimonas lacunae TaxID=477680 RepID=A0A173MI53_9BACT|nr:WG repeat-containing protein [Filimonas lacunae]BAV07179.1 hypothetical protein FLA_3202 [Filimonas lacunae]SIS93717.1 WG containing repeat-containing protein [Filimonas lacunae]
MKQLFVAFLLVAGLGATAQVKVKKTAKAAKSDTASQKQVLQEEEAPAVVEMLETAVVEAPAQANRVYGGGSGSRYYNDEDGAYYLSENYADKGISIVYKGESYNNKRYAIIETASRKKLTPFIFESFSAAFYGAGNTATVTINGKYGIVNARGEMVLPCKYDLLSSFTIDEQTYYIATIKNKAGIISENGEAILPFDYSYLESTSSGKHLFVAQQGDMYGLINVVSKEVVLPFEYSKIAVSREYIKVTKDDKYTFVGLNGKPVTKDWYSYLYVYDDFAVAETNGRFGVIDLTGKILFPFEYDKLERISNNTDNSSYFIARKNGKYGVLNREGNVVAPFEYDDLTRIYYHPLLVATQKGRKGLINMNGKVVLPLEYNAITVTEKSFLLKKEDKYGLLGRELNVILPVNFDYIKSISIDNSYRNNYFLVKQHGKVGVCTNTGERILDIIYDDLVPSVTSRYSESNTYKTPFIAVKKGKYGMVEQKADASSESKALIPFEYEDLDYLSTFLVIAKKSGKYGVLTTYENKVVLPFEYQMLSNKDGNVIGYKDGFVQFKSYGRGITPVTGTR